MPLLLKKLLLNKYTLGFVLVCASLLYVHGLIEANTTLELQAKRLESVVAELQVSLEKEKTNLLKQEDILFKDCEGRLEIVRASTAFLNVIQVEAKASEGKEKVDEKDILNSKLPDSILNGLRDPNRVR